MVDSGRSRRPRPRPPNPPGNQTARLLRQISCSAMSTIPTRRFWPAISLPKISMRHC